MPVSASKLVTLAQLQVQAERVKQELGEVHAGIRAWLPRQEERNFGS